jgi:translation initiation factor IF-3
LSNNKKDDVLLNERIRFDEIRCVGDDGEQHGIITPQEAMKIANEKGLDLVLISADAKPPVCKIMDYSKFKYQQAKKAKEARKKQIIIEIKEIKLSPKIAQNDINYKVRHAREFLEAKKHVRFRVFLSGREMANPQLGTTLLLQVYEMVKDIGDMEKEPNFEGRYVNMTVLPKKGPAKPTQSTSDAE